MTAGLGDGRFGPVYVGVDADSDEIVVIRTFTDPMTPDQQDRLLAELTQLCDRPLDHSSIAGPVGCGVEAGVPFLAHAYLPGVPVDEYLQESGPRPLSDVAVRVTHVAAALDFAAAAGVHHGALGPSDILFAPDGTGVSGFGLAQALKGAGVVADEISAADDIYALAAMTYELLLGHRYTGGDVTAAIEALPHPGGVDMPGLTRTLKAALSTDSRQWPSTALQFAASLHDALAQTPRPSTAPAPAAAPSDVGRLSFEADETIFAPESRASAPAAPPRPAAPAPPRASAPRAEPPVPTAAAAAVATVVPSMPEPRPELPLFDLSLHVPEPDPSDPDLRPTPLAAFSDPVPSYRPPPVVEPRRSSIVPVILTVLILALLGVGGALFLLRDRSIDAAFLQADDDVAGEKGTTGDRGDAGDRADGGRPSDDAGALSSGAPRTGGGTGASSDPSSLPPPGGATDDAVAGADGRVQVQQPPIIGEPAEPPSRPEPPPPAAQTARATATPEPPAATPRGGAQAPPSDTEPISGRLLVRSVPPGAHVLVNGQPRGETPVAIRGLDFGTHTVSVTAPGLATWQQRVTLTAERPAQSFEITLDGQSGSSSPATPAPAPPVRAAGSVQVESRPAGAQVWMDGRPLGRTPLTVPDVGAGTHNVRIEMPGYSPWSTRVAVAGGEHVRVAASLEQ